MTAPQRAGRLAGRSSVVTGAAGGIGRATAERFAAEGARLVLSDIDGRRLERLVEQLTAAGAEAVGVTGDVADVADAQAMIAAAEDHYGRLDVLVANAGVIPLTDVVRATPEDWDAVLRVDGRGMFLTCKYAVEAMLRCGGGSIVCLSSISGVAGQAGQATYGPAKFVASGLTKHLAVEWARHGIRVNAVAPGTIRTDRVRALELEPGGADYLREIATMHPMGRLGEPEAVAAAVLFLASDEASFITGAILPVDGGYLAR